MPEQDTIPQDEDGELVRVSFTADLDRDRLDEWLAANFNGEHVEVVAREDGEILETAGEDPTPFICPSCGEGSHGIRSSGDQRVYYHGSDDPCEVPRE
ncbi:MULTISPECIES: hypothetical protein [Halobacterium]|uniref:hypothetical protein n=1 Tax=Halobacterium TaxID=2239 RepID=UPI00073F0EFF|nr:MULTISPECIES: hypothetical protein [Halobacterium]MCG1002879.1 hypothetical protein [Halobacterium noricense]